MNLITAFTVCTIGGAILSGCSPESKISNLVGPSLSPEAPTSAELTAEVINAYEELLSHRLVNPLPDGYRIIGLPIEGKTSSIQCQDPRFEDACVFRLAGHDQITLAHELFHLNSAIQHRKNVSGTPEKRLSCQGNLCFVKNELTGEELLLEFIEEGYVINELTKYFDKQTVLDHYNEFNPKYVEYFNMYTAILELAGKSTLDNDIDSIDLFNTIYHGEIDANHMIAIMRIADDYRNRLLTIETFKRRIRDALFNPCPQGNLNTRYLEMASGRRARQPF